MPDTLAAHTHVEKARQAIREHKPQEARASLQTAMARLVDATPAARIGILQEIVAIQTNSFGQTDSDTLATALQLSADLQETQQPTDALQALEKFATNLNADLTPELSYVIYELSRLYLMTGNVSACQKLLHSWRQHPKLPQVPLAAAAFLSQQGNCSAQMQRFEEAESNMREALRLLKQCAPVDHPLTASTLVALAAVLLYREKPSIDEALTLLRQALGIQTLHLGLEHYEVAGTLTHMAAAHIALGQMHDAIALYQRVKQIYDKLWPEGSPDTVTLLITLLNLHNKVGNQADASTCLAAAQKLAPTFFPKEHPVHVMLRQQRSPSSA